MNSSTTVWIFAIQGLMSAMILALGFSVWRLSRRFSHFLGEDKLAAGLSVLEARMQEWDDQMRANRERMEQQLRILVRVCDRGKAILEQQTHGAPAFVSFEESELKTLVAEPTLQDETPSIPTLQQVEETKKRLKQEMALDLRSLLRDQLA